MLPHPRQDDTQNETNVSASTLVDWFNSCQEICVFWADKNSQKLGGPGCIVELDEAKIDRQFYNYFSRSSRGSDGTDTPGMYQGVDSARKYYHIKLLEVIQLFE
ncbi:uncharacterized protein LOC105423520 [Pogonomyrmex barbatus]|uniref:Uncharacterized protein LOC105423520 n=1 Tax=Pogonomyrmex barbatus TaxID=144034 RepID=A0A6I9VX30_9HYME|nr:uncharacterized protein LOC105423520 [Pogonomyrmex barbatus]